MVDKPFSGVAARLLEGGHVEEAALRLAIEESDRSRRSLPEVLEEKRLVSAGIVAGVFAEEFGLPFLDLSAINLSILDKNLASVELIRKLRIMPMLKRDSCMYVVVSDPTKLENIEEFRFSVGMLIEQIVVEDPKLKQCIDQWADQESNSFSMSDVEDDPLGNLENLEVIDATSVAEDDGEDVADGPVVKFVNKMLLSAIREGSSDLHFEPYEKSYRVRFRTDGVLREVISPPQVLATKIASRLKIMSSMDISERRKPQDGRIKLKMSRTKSIDFRVNTMPTLWGEKIVLRVLDSSSAKLGIESLGYQPDQQALYLEALNKPQGMILVTGPTGSGKTVSLYTGINILNTTERNISTAEDPVEINLDGINQVNVNNKQGMDFAGALRAFLRQDPDIIMVGEIRDVETANIAIKAAQTGHLVLSTLHTNSASETLTRLQNMGVPSFNIATSVSLIIAQRLARKLCEECKEEFSVPLESLLEEGFSQQDVDAGLKIFTPNKSGCNHCNRGYKGRVGIFEVVRITPKIQAIVMAEGNSLEIAVAAKEEGFKNLRASGLLKVSQGVTSLEELNRVTQE